MAAELPWRLLLDLIQPFDPETSKKGGWPPHPQPFILLDQGQSNGPTSQQLDMPLAKCSKYHIFHH
jgi:hypothetical protein